MVVRFHESFRLAIQTLRQAGIPLNSDTVIVRDGHGRLMVVRPEIADAVKVERMMKGVLGAYAAPIAIGQGRLAELLATDPAGRQADVDLDGVTYTIRYVDRRIVGADWLVEPAGAVSTPPRLVFGSLKGGVGRSTAIAVLAADLARAGKRVLVIDLDLEAPGLGSMLLSASDDPAKDRRPRYGALDYLVENGLGGIADDELSDFIGVSPFAEGFVEVIPVTGQEIDARPETFMAMLSRALVEDPRPAGPQRVADQVREMVERFSKWGRYDAVLIDARAGLAEISAAPLLALGAELLLFGSDQPQTFAGYRYLLSHLMNISPAVSLDDADDWRRRLSFVHAKAPASAAKRAPFRNRLYELCLDFLYDEESLDAEGCLVPADLSPSPNETGCGIPHDATYIEFHPNYQAFDPVRDAAQLDPEVYHGPFRAFLNRAWGLLGLERIEASE